MVSRNKGEKLEHLNFFREIVCAFFFRRSLFCADCRRICRMLSLNIVERKIGASGLDIVEAMVILFCHLQ